MKIFFFFAISVLAMYHACAIADDFDFWGSTHLIELKQGSPLSSHIALYRPGSYELADGTPVSFRRWYSTNWTDSRMTFMTQVHPQLGFIWGFSTGEKGEKYTIDRSLTVGLVLRHEFSARSSISVKGTSIVGGSLREWPCTADYGELGGVQAVNCRLAASTMAPSQTLQYLLREKPFNANTLLLEYKQTYN